MKNLILITVVSALASFNIAYAGVCSGKSGLNEVKMEVAKANKDRSLTYRTFIKKKNIRIGQKAKFNSHGFHPVKEFCVTAKYKTKKNLMGRSHQKLKGYCIGVKTALSKNRCASLEGVELK